MRFTAVSGLLALAGSAAAFPREMYEIIQESPELRERAAEIMVEHGTNMEEHMFEKRQFYEMEKFRGEQQKISTTGAHKWVAPGPLDLRGPCPGLNAFANHGYLPHNGYGTIQDFLDATQNVVGMGIGLASFLAVYGAVIDGDLTAWSIGGPPGKNIPIPTRDLLGVGQGIGGSHNKYESDASPTRPDLYQYGNSYKVRVQQFQQLFNLQPNPKTANFKVFPVLTNFRIQRFKDQVAKNKQFFNGPFTGVLVQPAAYTFIYRFMANHSEQHPHGLLNQDVLKSWFSISGNSGNFKWTPGYERIPNNWYRRDPQVPYDQTYFFQDLLKQASVYPNFLNIGGNTGKTNSFAGVDVGNLTGGVIKSQDLAKNNNFACLAYQFAANAKPDILENLSDNPAAQAALNNALSGVLAGLNCPNLQNIDYSEFDQYPGARYPNGLRIGE